MKVGLSLPQNPRDGAAGWRDIRDLAQVARAGGAGSVWVADHFFHRAPDDEVGLHEAFELLAAVAAVTPEIELGPLVAATSFRSPGLLAKMAATLDLVAEGRLILGVGCGWHEPEYRAFGYPFDHRVGRFEETVRVLRGLLDGERVTFSGTWVVVDDAVLLPAPARRIPLLIAADGPRMLRLTARYGDAWQAAWFGLPDASFREQRSRLEDACGLEGRSQPPDVFVGINVGEPDEPHVALDAAAVADALGAWTAEGVAHVQIGAWPATPQTWEPVLEGIRRYKASSRGPALAQ
jgi:alkanesulfonate monooxygenase SsuD/methylene tetrahydromethanopterin reductase-like flavin-dependent oxidoreductase (luciferase family)